MLEVELRKDRTVSKRRFVDHDGKLQCGMTIHRLYDHILDRRDLNCIVLEVLMCCLKVLAIWSSEGCTRHRRPRMQPLQGAKSVAPLG